MDVRLWPIDKIIPYARNARKIPPQAIDKVAASIREFGWRQPSVTLALLFIGPESGRCCAEWKTA